MRQTGTRFKIQRFCGAKPRVGRRGDRHRKRAVIVFYHPVDGAFPKQRARANSAAAKAIDLDCLWADINHFW